jgi:hypothetical protein
VCAQLHTCVSYSVSVLVDFFSLSKTTSCFPCD